MAHYEFYYIKEDYDMGYFVWNKEYISKFTGRWFFQIQNKRKILFIEAILKKDGIFRTKYKTKWIDAEDIHWDITYPIQDCKNPSRV